MDDYISNFRYIEFQVTFACNYDCPYCFWVGRLNKNSYMFREKGPMLPRTALRRVVYPVLRRLGVMDYSDAFLNFPVERWQELFRTLYKGKNAFLSFTGGEPFLVWKQMFQIIRTISEVSKEWMIRFDTNCTIIPDIPPEWRSHFSFAVSYHKQKVADRQKFIESVNKLTAGASSVMINRVVHHAQDMEGIQEEVDAFRAAGYYMNVSPANFNIDDWPESYREHLRRLTHPADYGFRVEGQSLGKVCLWPTVGFLLLPNGYAWTQPCSDTLVNLMKTQDPSPLIQKQPFICPTRNCNCVHQYSWIQEGAMKDRNAHSKDVIKNFVTAQESHRAASNG